MRARLWLGILAISLGCLAHSPDANAVILINEIFADPGALTGDANGDGIVDSSGDEFLELVNTGDSPVSLDSWTLADLVKVRHTFAAGTGIPAGGLLAIFGGTASTGTLALNNTGDTITLLDAQSLWIDSLTYGPEGGHDVSLTRSPDATGAFASHETVNGLPFSPGTTIDGREFLFVPPPSEEPLPDDPGPGQPLPGDGSEPVVPEPASLGLLGMGMFGLAASRGRLGRWKAVLTGCSSV